MKRSIPAVFLSAAVLCGGSVFGASDSGNAKRQKENPAKGTAPEAAVSRGEEPRSFLWPLCSWEPSGKSVRVLNVYWGKGNVGIWPLFNVPKEKGLHYYGPVWFRTENFRYRDRKDASKYTEARDRQWGIFPLLWMNGGADRDYSLFYPVAGWNSNFDFQRHLNFIGPFWNWEHECGLFPVFHWNYGAPGELKSFLFPLYARHSNMFLSIPYSFRDQDCGKAGIPQPEVLNCARQTRLLHTSWYNVLLLATWGKDQLRFTGSGKQAEYRHFGFFPLFRRTQMAEWSELGLGPLDCIGAWNKGPNVRMAHLLGPFGFWKLDKEFTEMHTLDTLKRLSGTAALALIYCGNEDHVLWQKPPATQYTQMPGYPALVFALRRMTAQGPQKEAKIRLQIQALLRLCRISEPVPATQRDADLLAAKLEKTFRTENQHRSHCAFFPFWVHADRGEKTLSCLPLLLSAWESSKNGNTDTTFASSFVFRKTHRATPGSFWSVCRNAGQEDLEEITEDDKKCTEYDLFRLLGWEREQFRIPFWKKGVLESVKQSKDFYWRNCIEGRIPWEEAAKQEAEFVARNTEFRTYCRTSFLLDWLYLSLSSDRGERKTYVACGLLGHRELSADSDDLNVLWFLYRHQKKAGAEREFIFPCFLKEKEGNKEKFSFCWRLFDREYENGKCTGGHILFFPY